jgi:hypothetical protein
MKTETMRMSHCVQRHWVNGKSGELEREREDERTRERTHVIAPPLSISLYLSLSFALLSFLLFSFPSTHSHTSSLLVKLRRSVMFCSVLLGPSLSPSSFSLPLYDSQGERDTWSSHAPPLFSYGNDRKSSSLAYQSCGRLFLHRPFLLLCLFFV